MVLFMVLLVAGLTKHPNSPYYTAIFYDGAGQKVRRSTKQRDRRNAMKVAVEWEETAKAGRERRLTETQARRVVEEILKRTTGETLHFHTARSWFTEWLAGKRGAVEPKSFTKYEQVKDNFLNHLGERANLNLEAIGPTDVRSFRDELAKEGRSPSTVNQTIRKVLTAPFTAAQRQGYIQANPCSAVEPLIDASEGQREPFSNEEVRTLLGAADNDWRGAILFGYHTALRFRDITDMQWEAIDLNEETVKVCPRKSKRNKLELVIPLHSEVIAWLKIQTQGIGKAPVLPSLYGKGTGGRLGLSNQFKALMTRAKIKGRILRKKNGAGRETNSLSFHSLRHSCVSAMANAGIAPEIRKKLSGHADDRSHAIYTHHAVETLREAIRRMPGVSS
jgi:integrase